MSKKIEDTTLTMPKELHYHIGNWLENAGIVGLYRILGKECKIDGNNLVVPTSALENFAQKFFGFFNKYYGSVPKNHQIIQFESTLQKWEANDYKDFNEDDLKKLQKWLDLIQSYNNTASFYLITQAIEDPLSGVIYKRNKNGSIATRGQKHTPIIAQSVMHQNITELKNTLKPLKQKNYFVNHATEAQQLLQQADKQFKEYITYFKRPDSEKYMTPRALGFNILSHAWGEVLSLNKNDKHVDVYKSFTEYFVQPVYNQYTAKHSKTKCMPCMNCGKPCYSNAKFRYSWLNGMGYDYGKKQGNAWNKVNNEFMCAKCALMYACVPAGFAYNYDVTDNDQGLFINYNHSVQGLIEANNAVFTTMMHSINENPSASAYAVLGKAYETEQNASAKYSLADVQVITYKHGNYDFKIVPSIADKVIAKANNTTFGKKENSKNLLSFLGRAGYKLPSGDNQYLRLYDIVMQYLFNSTSLTSDIVKFENMLISEDTNAMFNTSHIMDLIIINTLWLQSKKINSEGFIMEVTPESLKKMRGNGMRLLQSYKNSKSKNKLNSLIYQLQEAIISNNPERYISSLMNACSNQHQLMPSNLINNMNDEKTFKQYALAFTAGLIDKKQDTK